MFGKKDTKAETIETYNQSAEQLAKRYDEIGPRINDLEETFALVHTKNPKVFEIGFGTGREAYQILKRTSNYIGLDVAEGMLKIAERRNPKGKFILGDVEDCEFPQRIDIVFAFASLIHTEKKQLEKVFDAMYKALKPGGVARISLKYAPAYKEKTQHSAYGTRTYYLYSKEDIEKFPAQFLMLKSAIHNAEEQEWLELLLQKPHA